MSGYPIFTLRLLLAAVAIASSWLVPQKLCAQPPVVASFPIKVVVAIAPYAYLIERIGGEKVEITTLVPAAVSVHSYEPTMRQILQAAEADIWFSMGESFEARATNAVGRARSAMRLVNLTSGIDLISASSCSCHAGYDAHLWLSPKRAKGIARTIASSLSALAPSASAYFQANLEELNAELDQLDRAIIQALAHLPQRSFLVAHPAYTYFAQDYHLTQLCIENEGKEPSARQLTQLLAQAKQAAIAVIFVQPQHSSKAAEQIAQALKARLVYLDPYSADYFGHMYAFLLALSQEACSHG